MAEKTIQIAGFPDIILYDDGDFSKSIIVDSPIQVNAPPEGPDDVARAGDIPDNSDTVTSSDDISSNAVVRGDAGDKSVKESLMTVDDSGSPNIPSGQSYKVNNIQVLTDQQPSEPDAVPVNYITLQSGSDTVDMAAFNQDLSIMIDEINAIKDVLNNLLAKLRTHGIIAT